MKRILAIILLLAIALAPMSYLHAATTATKTKTTTKTTKKVAVKPVPKIKILIVPGHDDDVWGAQYGNIKEADMNLNVATDIYNILKKDKRFEVHITRNFAGYTKEIADYLANNYTAISKFRTDAKAATKEKISSGTFTKVVNPPHAGVTEDTAIKLYGINKWANENKMDAMIHVHFNDYPRADKWEIGKYKGFAIYMPEDQMANAVESQKLAKSIFAQLHKKYSVSDYEKEVDGMIPDQSLIALGTNGTLDASVRSVLIEYGYIYRFKNAKLRHKAYPIMASLTATGIKNYFFAKK